MPPGGSGGRLKRLARLRRLRLGWAAPSGYTCWIGGASSGAAQPVATASTEGTQWAGPAGQRPPRLGRRKRRYRPQAASAALVAAARRGLVAGPSVRDWPVRHREPGRQRERLRRRRLRTGPRSDGPVEAIQAVQAMTAQHSPHRRGRHPSAGRQIHRTAPGAAPQPAKQRLETAGAS